MVVYYYLHVLCRLQLRARRVVAWLCPGVHVDDLPVPLVLKQKAGLVISDDLRDQLPWKDHIEHECVLHGKTDHGKIKEATAARFTWKLGVGLDVDI